MKISWTESILFSFLKARLMSENLRTIWMRLSSEDETWLCITWLLPKWEWRFLDSEPIWKRTVKGNKNKMQVAVSWLSILTSKSSTGGSCGHRPYLLPGCHRVVSASVIKHWSKQGGEERVYSTLQTTVSHWGTPRSKLKARAWSRNKQRNTAYWLVQLLRLCNPGQRLSG